MNPKAEYAKSDVPGGSPPSSSAAVALGAGRRILNAAARADVLLMGVACSETRGAAVVVAGTGEAAAEAEADAGARRMMGILAPSGRAPAPFVAATTTRSNATSRRSLVTCAGVVLDTPTLTARSGSHG